MKKTIMNIRTMAALLIASAAFTACSNEDSAVIGEQPAATQTPQVYTLTLQAANAMGAQHRALELDGTKLVAKWAAGDELTVINVTSMTPLGGTLTASNVSADGKTCTFSGTLTGTIEVGNQLALHYHATSGTQDGTLESAAASDQANAIVTVASVDEGNITISESKASFTTTTAVLKLTLKDGSANALNATSLKMTVDGVDFFTASPTAATYTANGNGVLYFAVPRQMEAADKIAGVKNGGSPTEELFNTWMTNLNTYDVTFTATVGSDTYTATKTGYKLAGGKYYATELTMEKQATDLSMVDNAGAARSTMSTANCYMVHTAGDYKLPLVYGNAIKDGAANTAAYTGVSGTNTTLDFPNHAGTAINAPWITKSTTGEGVNKGMGITVASAELLWQDAQGLITAVGISGDYLTLTVGKNAATQQGNAVVAAKDGSGNIVWSWHIWVTTETFADATLTTVATGSHNYQVTPVNLGWVPTGGEGKQGYAPYYQWGRKDAFIPGTWNATTDHTVYNISNTAVTGLTYENSNAATIADNIKNPTKFYNGMNGPCNTQYYNMWDAQQTGTDNITTATKKTVYDPCPAGFCVPTGNLYYFMGGNGASYRSMGTSWDDTNKGATWDTSITGTALFFPASGCRNYSSGALSNVGSFGYYWSASPNSNGRNLFFRSNSWAWDNVRRAFGLPVRAVAEE